MRVQQINKGSYAKVMTRVEEKLLERLVEEEKGRLEFAYKLEGQYKKIAQNLLELGATVVSLNSLVEDISQRVYDLAAAVDRLSGGSTSDNVYSREEVNALLSAYCVEEITYPYGEPKRSYFEAVSPDKKTAVYEHFPGGRLRKWPDATFGPGTMRRYSIAAYTETGTEIPLNILHEDYFVVVLNGSSVASLSGSNINGRADAVTLTLTPGWNLIEFMIANKEYGCSFDIGTDLASAVYTLTPTTAQTTCLGSGQVMPEHINQGAGFYMKSLKTDRLTVGRAVIEESEGSLVVDSSVNIRGNLSYTGNGGGSLVTSYVWPAVDFYLPPGQLIDDPQATNGSAVKIPAGTPSSVIDCPGGVRLYPGSYVLYLRLKPTAASGIAANVTITEDHNIIGSEQISASGMSTAKYNMACVPFEYSGGDLSIAVTGGSMNTCLDYLFVRDDFRTT